MFSIPQVAASLCLVTAPALVAGSQELQLRYDANQHVACVVANVDAEVLLLVGPRADPVIRVGGIDVLVQPRLILPLGTLRVGDQLSLPVPSERDVMGLQLVGVDLAKFNLITSAPVIFDLRDLIDRSFGGALRLTVAGNSVDVGLTAPSTGHVLFVDGVDSVGDATRVWLRLEVPNPSEIVCPVLTPLAMPVGLPVVLGRTVELHMAREVRGSPVLPVYKLMQVLEAHPNPFE